MTNYTIPLTETESNALLTHCVDIDEWLTNFAQVTASKVIKRITTELIEHCNANDIAIATGVSAQIEQALNLGIVANLKDVPTPVE